MKRSFFIILSLALLVAVSSCVNEDYDIEKIKLDEVAGLEGIVLPVGSTQVISISDFLTLDQEDGMIKTDDDGNFYVGISDSVLDQNFTFDSFSLSGYDPQPKEIGAGSPVTVPSFNTNKEYTVQVAFPDVNYDVEISQNNMPEIITGIRYVDVTSNIEVTLTYDKTELPFNEIHICAGATIDFPEWIVLGEITADYLSKENSHKLLFAKNMSIRPEGTTITVPIDKLDFAKLPENQGIIGDGRLYLYAPITLKNGKLQLNSSNCITSGTFTPKVTSKLHVDPMQVESICLSGFNLGDAANISQDIDFSGMLPEMLYDENVVCDFSDLRLKIWMKNGLPFSGAVNTLVDSYKNGADSPLKHYEFAFPFTVDPAGQVIEHQYSESGTNSSIKVEGFNSILYPVPDFLRINTGVTIDSSSDSDNYGVLVPGSTYNVQCGYEFIAPLSFGKDFRLGLTQDIEAELEITEVEVAEAQLKLNLVNALPLNLDLSAQAIDAQGNVLEHINVELVGEIKGGTVQSPAVNPIALKLTNNGELKLAGVRVSITASASDAKAALNKHQFIQLTDISVSLPQGIKYTFNE